MPTIITLRQNIAIWNRILESEIWLEPDTIKSLYPVVKASAQPTAEAVRTVESAGKAPKPQAVIAQSPTDGNNQMYGVAMTRFFSSGSCVLTENLTSLPANLLMASIAGCFNVHSNIERYQNKIYLPLSQDALAAIKNNDNQMKFNLLDNDKISMVAKGIITKITNIFEQNQASNQRDSDRPFYVFIMGTELNNLAKFFPEKISHKGLQVIQCQAPSEYLAKSEQSIDALKELRLSISKLTFNTDL